MRSQNKIGDYKMNNKQVLKLEAIKNIQAWYDIKPNDKIYTTLTHVSSSGMSRSIKVFIMRDNKPENITNLVAKICDYRIDDKNGGLKVGGCGMDMGFAVVYDLSYQLFPKGFDVVGIGRNGDTSGHDMDGGYALKQAWL
jgi:hypothetical protein